MSLTVLNRHHYRGSALPTPSVYIGRGTPLGNPFTKAEHGERALELYKVHLCKAVEHRDPEILKALALAPGTFIVCSCKPAPCHGDVVAEVWEWLAGKGEW
jgi:hypothetical protein